ncbi:MAG: AAA family ATPase [Eubacterium sp.]|nr:AAA family ATPase [Eubacterium sp.]
MKIKRLMLQSFGKFQDRTIELSDGFNLIYAPSAAGKSTVQHFIEGMFFGFYRPYRKQGSYAEAYEKYRPQNSAHYCGAIVLEDDSGREIRIERDFLKAEDGVAIYDNESGEDITAFYPYDSVTHQNLPLGEMKITPSIYNNTVNIRQMAGKTDADMAQEANVRLVELAAEENESLALGRVRAYLKDKKKALGQMNPSDVPREKAEAKLTELQEALTESQRIFDRIQTNQMKIQQYKKKIAMARERIQTAGQKQHSEAFKAAQEIRNKAAALEEEGRFLEERLEALRPCAQIDPRMYGRVKILESNLAGAKERSESLKQEISELEGKCEEITGRCDQIRRSLKGLSRYDVQRDYKQYKASLESPMTEEEFWVDKPQASGELVAPSGRTLSFPVVIAAMVIGLFVVGMALINPGEVFSGAAWFAVAFVGWVLILGGGVMLWYQNRTANDEALSAVDEIFEDEEIEKEMPEAPEAPLTAAAILKKYGRANGEEFERFVQKVERIFTRLEKLTMEESLFVTQLENKRAELTKVERDMESFKMDFADELQAAGVEDVEAYGDACEKRGEYEKLQDLLEDNRKSLAALGDIPELPVEITDDNPVLMISSKGEEIRAREAIYAFNEEIKRLRMERDHLSGMAVSPASIREQIETLKNAMAFCDQDVQACDKAAAVIARLEGGMKTVDMSALEQRIGALLKQITGHYDTVVIDEHFNIEVQLPETGRYVPISQLDGKVIDQIYFALRFGLEDGSRQEAALPLVLDDPFVNYGLERKKAVLGSLWKLSADRQVLLFTEGGDEKRILDSTGLSYSGILL